MKVKEYSLKYNKTGIDTRIIRNSTDTSEVLREVFDADEINIYECFYILLLNNSLKVQGFAKISQGGITQTTADTRLIAKYAIDSLASNVVLAHNHPSGNTSPSGQDKRLTDNIVKALDLLEIKVIDHIILTDNDYYSFRDGGLL
ncbi:MAG: DNA repair protein RadC [Lentimicrobiaceae bacterium]|nr:DNA repair protein RadC [Lentimicrobiaceae bacterium]